MPKNKKSQWTANHYNENVKAVLHIALRQILILERDQPDVEDVKQVILVINPSARGIDLSNLSVAELDAFQLIINQAVEMARPYCEEQDLEAAAALAANDVRNKRIWRSPPKYIDFTKEKRSDNHTTEHQGLPSGPDQPRNEPEHDSSIPSRP